MNIGRPKSRDDFTQAVKRTMMERVGMRCSNPDCWQLTGGPNEDPSKSSSIGVAAHITAAAPGGPRFDPGLSREERRSISNGIWLCQNCAHLIDTDERTYTTGLLNEWKKLSEQAASLALTTNIQRHNTIRYTDQELIEFFRVCFERPAFQTPFVREGSVEDFDKAIEDTITAINTGVLRDRNGSELNQNCGQVVSP